MVGNAPKELRAALVLDEVAAVDLNFGGNVQDEQLDPLSVSDVLGLPEYPFQRLPLVSPDQLFGGLLGFPVREPHRNDLVVQPDRPDIVPDPGRLGAELLTTCDP